MQIIGFVVFEGLELFNYVKKLSLNHKWQLYTINFETLVLGFTRLQGFVGLVPGVPLLFHTQSLRPRERYLKFEACISKGRKIETGFSQVFLS